MRFFSSFLEKLAACSSFTIEVTANKTTGTFGNSVFLPGQLTFGRKTSESISKIAFAVVISAQIRKKCQNTERYLKYFREIIIPYIKNQHLQNKIPEGVMNVSFGQMTIAVL